ncbi:RNA polymerase subunit sigma [Arthrobacter sp. MYb224]|uniref:RNA polymerase sigma factor n=1 Tax=Micrococcaceae TaxID=1268 RepID=UPI000CFC683E|nr:sigma-70 family RNA polymerase sigma factor [Arthrobacter sp. MYb224]PRA00591.1 RNA polymerase subunit sigma [Arthrobacter sp. MYb224]
MTGDTDLVGQAATLFEEFRGGRRELLEELVRLLNPTLWHLARSCRLERADAEDVVQTAWLRLVDRAETIRDPQTVLAWLGTTVRREAWRVARDRGRTQPWENPEPGAADLGPGPMPGPAEALLRDEARRTLWAHFSRLTPRCQAILRVISRGGAPDYAALSAALGIPVGSIGPTRGRCLDTLRTYLTADPAWSTQ